MILYSSDHGGSNKIAVQLKYPTTKSASGISKNATPHMDVVNGVLMWWSPSHESLVEADLRTGNVIREYAFNVGLVTSIRIERTAKIGEIVYKIFI